MTSVLPSIRCVLAAALLAAPWQAGAAAPFDPVLSIYGETHVNACTPASKSKLQAGLKASGVPDQQSAWRAIEIMLCAPITAQARGTLAAFLPKSGVSLCDGGTDYPSGNACRRVRRGVPDELFAAGEAWGVELQAFSESIQLSFYRDEACMEDRTLGRAGGRWVVEESVHACD